jgi:hypothetical protein
VGTEPQDAEDLDAALVVEDQPDDKELPVGDGDGA